MTPEMEAAAWEGLATNHAAQTHAEGHDTVARWLTELDQVTISRERLAELERLPENRAKSADAGAVAMLRALAAELGPDGHINGGDLEDLAQRIEDGTPANPSADWTVAGVTR